MQSFVAYRKEMHVHQKDKDLKWKHDKGYSKYMEPQNKHM
jgi:hypothetical protein